MSIYRVRAVVNGWQGGPGLNTFYFDASGGPSGADAATVAGRVRGAFDVFKTMFHSSVTVQVQPQVDVLEELNGVLIGSFGIATPAVVTGTSANVTGAAEVAAGLVLDTGLVVDGRRLKGRAFLSPLQGPILATVLPPAGLVTAVNAFGVAVATATPPAATAPLVVWRRPTPSVAGLIRPVLTASCAPKWFALRSRRD